MSKTVKSLRAVPKWIWPLCAAFLVMQTLICRNVFPMGDDFMYGSFGQEGVVAPVFSYYLWGNGRWLINVLDSLQLLFGQLPYLVLTPWILLLLGFLLYRLVSLMTGTSRPELFAFSLGLLSLIDVQMSRECIYWITGAMNYLLPALLLLAGMVAALRLREEELSRRKRLALETLCVLSCLTMEQYGLMSFGWMLLLWGYDCLRKKAVPRRTVLLLVLSGAALSTVLFAPGNLVRVEDAASKKVPVLFKVNDLICYDYYSMVTSPFLAILEGLCAVRLWKNGKRILPVLSAVNALVLLGFHNAFLHASFKLVVASMLVTLLSLVPCLIAVFRRCGKGQLLSLVIIGGGSQLMLLPSDLWGFRTSLCWVLLLILFILVFVSEEDSPGAFLAAVMLLGLAIHPILGLAAFLLGGVCLFRKKRLRAAAAALLLAAVLVGLSDEVLGYQGNRAVQLEIIRAARSAAEDGEVAEIVLRPYGNFLYGWNTPPLSEFHEAYYRSYYGIPEDVVIRYEPAPAES